MFWWWGNIMMALWAVTTMAAGIRYADGRATNGLMAFMGEMIDRMFGLDTCRKIPSGNQNLNDLKNPCYFCKQGAPFIHAGDSTFVVNYPQPPDVLDCTGVSGVGGVVDGHIVGHGSKAIDPVTYINKVITGSTTGSIAKGEYDKKRFKHGTPFIYNQTGSTFGYYYSTDAKGQEVPLIPPAQGTTTLPTALAANPAAYGGSSATSNMPIGWNAYINYPNGTTGAAYTFLLNGYPTNPVSSSTFDPLNGFVNNASNLNFIAGPLSGINNLKYKSFSPIASESSASTHPSSWTMR